MRSLHLNPLAYLMIADFNNPASLPIASICLTNLIYMHACWGPIGQRTECCSNAYGSPSSVSHCGHVSLSLRRCRPSAGAPLILLIVVLVVSAEIV